MPEISRFLGIIITMYWYDNIKHHKPHFHARYNEFKCAISLPNLEVLEGKLPTRVLSLVMEWAQKHVSELEENWNLVINDKMPKAIAPLI